MSVSALRKSFGGGAPASPAPATNPSSVPSSPAASSASTSSSTAAADEARVSLPTLTNVRWRVDITISTNTRARVFKPTIPMQLTLSDGTIQQFECSVEKFHELRYSVAKSLKHAQDLQHHPTLTREFV